jgi:hypothetical protein
MQARHQGLIRIAEPSRRLPLAKGMESTLGP